MVDAGIDTGITSDGVDASQDRQAAVTAGDWLDIIKRSESYFQTWRERVEKILKIYTEERGKQDSTRRRYSLLWANVETLKPTIYSRPPVPVVTRRFKDRDRVAKEASEVLERSLIYTVDKTALDAVMRGVRDDFLLAGRGTAWVRYEATTEPLPVEAAEGPHDEASEPPERITSELVVCDYVSWADFGHNIARTWQEVSAVWRRVFMTRQELVNRFGYDIGVAVALDHKPDPADNALRQESTKKATIYEIWDKASGKVYWVAKGYSDFLDEQPPMLDLEGFFPCPPPCYATHETGKLIPIPDYVFYQNQAEQIDDLSARIDKLTDALKLVGFYPAGQDGTAAIENAIKPGVENVLIPVAGWAAFSASGGSNQIQWLPVDQVIKVLQGCQEVKASLINDVYQITGISDIIRGESNPNETATAQSIKNQWGSVRVRDKQTELSRFARDLLRIAAEVIADKFQAETLLDMTGVKLPTEQEVATNVQQAALKAQGMGQPFQPPPPDKLPVTIDAVVELFRDDRSRGFRIDVETDSTISADEQQDKKEWSELLMNLSSFLQQAMPIGQQIPQFVPVIGEMLMTTVRKFRSGRQLEDTIEMAMESIQATVAKNMSSPQPNPDMEKAKIDLETTKVKAQAETAKAQMDMQAAHAKHQMDVHKMQLGHQQAVQRAAMPPAQGGL